MVSYTNLSASQAGRAQIGEPGTGEVTFLGLYHRKRSGATFVALILFAASVLPWLSSRGATMVDLSVAGTLVGVFALGVAVSRAAERWRYSIAGAHTQDLLTSCTLAAALLLPSTVACGVVVLVYISDVATMRAMPMHRWLYAMAAVILSALAAQTAMALVQWSHTAELALGVVTYLAVNPLVMASALVVCGQRDKLKRYASRAAWSTELASAAIGVLLVVCIERDLYLGLLALPAMLILQRFAAWAQVVEGEVVDPDTGVLNEQAFAAVADQVLLGKDQSSWMLIHVASVGLETSSMPAYVETLRAGLRSDDQVGGLCGGIGVLIKSDAAAARNIAARCERALAARGYLVTTSVLTNGTLSERLNGFRRSSQPHR